MNDIKNIIKINRKVNNIQNVIKTLKKEEPNTNPAKIVIKIVTNRIQIRKNRRSSIRDSMPEPKKIHC